MGLPSVCCEYVLLPLVNNEGALAYNRTEYIARQEIQAERGRKQVELRETPAAAGKARCEVTRCEHCSKM